MTNRTSPATVRRRKTVQADITKRCAAACYAVMLVLSSALTVAQEPTQPPPLVREIYVPFEDLNVLLEGSPQHVFLGRAEYEQLLAEAARSQAAAAPVATSILSADYQIAITEGRAAISADLAIEVLNDGIHAVALPVSGVGLKSLTIDGTSAAVGRSPDGNFVLFISGKGSHNVHLELTAVVQTSAAQQVLQVQLPATSSSHLQLTVPGNVELKSGASVVRREVDEQLQQTRFELLPAPGPLTLVMSLNNRILRRERVMVARSVLLDEIAEGIERLHVTSTFSILHGAADELELRLPATFEIVSVNSDALSRWSSSPEMDGQQKLRIELRQPMTEPVTVTITAVRFARDDTSWQFPNIVPLDVEGQVAVVGLLMEQGWRVQHVQADGLIPIDRDVLMHTLNTQLLSRDPGAPPIRPVLAFYAPQADYRLAAQFEKPPQQLEVVTSLLLNVDEKGHELTGAFSLRPQVDRLFQVAFQVPPNWKITSIRDTQGTPIPFELYDIAGGGQRVSVRLPAAVPPLSSFTLAFTARGNIEGWLGDWTERTFDFPIFAVEGAQHDRGAVAILAFSDLDVRPEQLNQLAPLNNDEKEQYGLAQQTDLAFRYDALPYSATFHVSRRQPSINAQTFSFLKIGKEGIEANYEVIFQIREASTRRLRLSLPADTPSEVTITGLGGTIVKESTATVEDGARVWHVLLADNVPLNAQREGSAHIQLSFEQPLPDVDQEQLEQTAQEISLPIVKALDVEYQTGTVAVEGDAELQVAVATDARKVTLADLARSQRQPGKRLLGTFGFVGDPVPVTAQVQRPKAHPLPAAIAEKAELWTAIAKSGKGQTVARFHLRTKALLLEARLPTGADLWSIWLDDQPITPQLDKDAVLINLPAANDKPLRTLDIAFEAPMQPVDLWGNMETSAPHLYLPAKDNAGTAAEVQVTDLQWHLLLPKGYGVTHTGAGTVQWKQPPQRIRLWEVLLAPLAVALHHRNWEAATSGSIAPSAADHRDDYGYVAGETSTMPEPASMAPREMMESLTKSEVDQVFRADSGAANLVDESRSTDLNPPAVPLGADSDTLASPQTEGKKISTALGDLAGVRSLKVDLQKAFENADDEQIVELQSLGHAPVISVRVINQARLRFASWAAALTILLLGIWRMQAGARPFLRYFVVAGMLIVILPAATGWLFDVHEMALAAGMALAALIPIALVYALLRAVVQALRKNSTTATATAAVLLAGVLALPAAGQERTVDCDLLQLVVDVPPVTLPPDAILIPYDPAPDADPRTTAERILVPYGKYVELWNRAHPDQPLVALQAPAEFGLAGSSYSATLTAEDVLEIRGTLEFEVFVDRTVGIPLSLAGGVLTSALLDGEPARVQLTTQDSPQQQQQANNAPDQAAIPAQLVVYATGRGRKKLELTLRLKVERSGGWRSVAAQLPTGAAGQLSLTVPDVGTEVRLSGVADRNNFETTTAGETIETALLPDTAVVIQWRPKVSEGQVDRALTVESTAVLDVQEDGLRLAWQARLQFRRGRREDFSFLLPADYLVQRVIGENVRGWTSQPTDQGQELDVTLLRAAADQETISIYLSKRLPIAGDQPVSVAAPTVQVVDASLHHGSLVVRRSPLIELRATQSEQVTRTDLDAGAADALMTAAGQEQRPLPIQPFQAFHFATVPFTLTFEAQPIQAELSAEAHTILRVAERELLMEVRFDLVAARAPVHLLQIRLPGTFNVDQVSEQEWVVTEEEGGRLLTVYLSAGRTGAFGVNVSGSLGARAANDPIELPRLQVVGAQRQEGQIVVQVDPAYRVRTQQLQNIDITPLERTNSWLMEQQRELARHGLVLGYRSPDYSGRLELARRDPVVRCTTLTNVRITPRAIQETIMIEFRVLEAGIQRLQFLVPARMATARYHVPALRQKTITPVENGDPNQPLVRVQLELQDELMDVIRVVIERDEVLTPQPHSAPIPVIETGEVEAQYVTLQNSSRDEVLTVEQPGVEELTRQQTKWRALAELDVTQGYAVIRGAENPRLIYQTKQRQAVETAGARIGLSETILVIDESGAYRAVQALRVENTSEQYLEIELPNGAQLWTAQVAGEAVKPTAPDNGAAAAVASIRIPLVKTEIGDADYPVTLVYAGKLKQLKEVGIGKIHFPLIRTKNIHIERSQMALYLPEGYRWYDFRGASRLTTENEYASGFKAYFGEQVQRITKFSESGSSYERARAYRNLSQLEAELQSDFAAKDSSLKAYGQEAQTLLDTAKQQVMSLEEQQDQQATSIDNREQLHRFYQSQDNRRSRNVVESVTSNFSYSLPALDDPQQAAPQTDAAFNKEWLEQNRLSNAGKGAQVAEELAKPGQRIVAKGAVDDELRDLNRDVQLRYSADQMNEQQLAQQQAAEPLSSVTDGTSSAFGATAAQPPMYNSYQPSSGYRTPNSMGGGAMAGMSPTPGQPGGMPGGGGMAVQYGTRGFSAPGMDNRPEGEYEADQAQILQPSEFADAGLASLTINVPKRGQVFYFQSPRGQVDLSAQAVSSLFVERLIRIAGGLILGGLFLLVLRKTR